MIEDEVRIKVELRCVRGFVADEEIICVMNDARDGPLVKTSRKLPAEWERAKLHIMCLRRAAAKVEELTR